MNIERSSNNVYADFFEKTGINLTDEPLDKLPESLDDDARYIYENLRTKPRKLIPRIQKLIKKYPNIPSLKNYLYSAYVLTGKEEQAMKILNLTIKKHPKYIFGICAFIERINEKEELRKLEHLLRTPRSILSFCEKGEKVHILEFLAYQSAACHYEALTGEFDAAKERLRGLVDLGVEEERLRGMASKIMIGRVAQNAKRMKEEMDKRIKVKAISKFDFEYIEEPLEVQNGLLFDLFYNNEVTNFEKGQIDRVMALPREGLVKDLELIVTDAIRRQGFFEEQVYKYETHEFLIHSLYFLGALKSEVSLELVLDLLRMDEDFLDYWLGDSKEECLVPTIYLLGENQLDKLKDYVLEENNVGYDRAIVSTVVAQVAMQQPDRRKEVLDWFKTVLEHHLQHPENEGIIDSHFLMVCVSDLLNIRAKELLYLIQRLFEKDWIPESYSGDLAQVESEIEKPFSPYYIKPLPLDIYEFYSKKYESRKAPYTGKKLQSMVNDEDPVEVLIRKSFFKEREQFSTDEIEEEDAQNPVSTIVKREQGIGRNDPCECGSGKKYKHCCLRN